MSTYQVAFLYDLPHWILGRMATALADRVHNNDYNGIVLRAPHSALSTRWIELKTDVLFFLGEPDFLRCHKWVSAPVIVAFHHETDGWEARLEEALYFCDAICTFNSGMFTKIAGLTMNTDLPIFRFDYFLDTDRFTKVPGTRNTLLREIGCSDDTMLIGWSASPLSGLERKGVDRYWKFVREASQEFGKRVRLVIFGPNPSDGGWRWSMIPEDIRHMISIVPFQDEQKLVELYGGLDFYLCLSREEGGPYPVIECMLCGVPIITTSVGVVPDIIRDGWNGFIVDADNYIERISDIIRTFTSDGDAVNQLAERARATAHARFQLDEKKVQLYTEIVRVAVQHWKQRSFVGIMKRRVRTTVAALMTAITHSRDYARRYIVGR